MQKGLKYNSSKGAVFLLHVHLVFVTKFRRKCFKDYHLALMEKMFTTVCLNFKATLEEFNGEADHVHLLISYPPTVTLSKLISNLKGLSSYCLSKECGILHTWYKKGVVWSPSYFACSCGGAPVEIIKKYIEKQHRPTLA